MKASLSDVVIGCDIGGTGDDSDHSGGNGGDGDCVNLDLAKKQEHQPEGGDGERDHNCG